jgi:hypothetical protein
MPRRSPYSCKLIFLSQFFPDEFWATISYPIAAVRRDLFGVAMYAPLSKSSGIETARNRLLTRGSVRDFSIGL